MRILSIDTATRYGGLSLWDQGAIIGEWLVSGGLTHSARLMPALDFLLKEAGWDIEDLDLVAVASGPGSFTGLRIGMATAKGLAQGLEIDLIGVPTLKFWASAFAGGQGLVLPLLDARRTEFYTALYEKKDWQIKEIMPAHQARIDHIAKSLEEYEGPIWAVGDAVSRDAQMLKEQIGDKLRIAPETFRLPRPGMLAHLAYELWQTEERESYKLLRPNYLRKPEAERKLEAKMQT